MRKGFAIIFCGNCHKKIPIIWDGMKYKLPCPWCGTEQTVKNTRLKNFQPYEEKEN